MYKVVLVGNSNVGKTSIVTRMVKNVFFDVHESTIGSAFVCLPYKNAQGVEEFKIGIWDTSGQEKYRCICPLYYRTSDIIIICFDITDRDSYDQITYWIREIRRQFDELPYIIIVGNKNDLANRFESSEKLTTRYPDYPFIEISAKTGCGVQKLHDLMVSYLLEIHITRPSIQSNQITLEQKSEQKNEQKNEKSCSCYMR